MWTRASLRHNLQLSGQGHQPGRLLCLHKHGLRGHRANRAHEARRPLRLRQQRLRSRLPGPTTPRTRRPSMSIARLPDRPASPSPAASPPSPGTGKTVTFTDTGLTVNTAYNYYVTAVNAGRRVSPRPAPSLSPPARRTPCRPRPPCLPGRARTQRSAPTPSPSPIQDWTTLTPAASLQYETRLDGGPWSAPSSARRPSP